MNNPNPNPVTIEEINAAADAAAPTPTTEAAPAEKPAQKPIEIPGAESLNEKAARNFRKRLVTFLNEGCESGVNEIEIDVTGVETSLVKGIADELNLLGYKASFNNHRVIVRSGKTASILKVRY